MIGPAEIFTIFFVTLGPIKILGPFAQGTRELDDATMRRVALWAFGIATVAVVVGSLFGRALAAKWHVSIASLLIAAGIVFLLVALRQLLGQYEPERTGQYEPERTAASRRPRYRSRRWPWPSDCSFRSS